MSVHFDPRTQPVSSGAKVNHPQPVQKRLPSGDSFEICGGDAGSPLDYFIDCFKAVWDFFVRLFSPKPITKYEIEDTKAIRDEIARCNEQGMSVPTPESYPEYFRKFPKNDRDYTGMSKKNMDDARRAEGLCAFPKLAVYLRDAYVIDIEEACRRINQAIDIDRAKTFLTPRLVMMYYYVLKPEVVEIPDLIMPGDNNLYKDYEKNDINSPQDPHRSFAAEIGCEFPKLALCLVREGGIDSMAEAVRRINEVHKKYPQMNAMSAFFVLTNSKS